jgi:hypothetical protein
MKTALSILILACSTAAVVGAEYVTLTPATPSKVVRAADLIEVIGTNMNNNGLSVNLNLTFADGATIALVLRGKENGLAFADMRGNSFTGLTNVTLAASSGTNACATLKITPAEELPVAAPGTVVVVPEGTTGDLSLVVDSSDDLVTWSQIHAQGITAAADSKFYRLRIIKTVSP